MDVNIKIPALEKLVDYVASGIGSVAGSMLAPWQARREVQAKQIAAKGEAETLDIRAEGQSSALQTIATAQADARRKLIPPNIAIQGELTIAETVEQRIQFQEEKRQKNIGSVVRLAAAELEGKEVPDHEPDHDLIARFFNDVQDVSSEEIQKLWAKVLSGEVERPGSTSIQSLGILRNLDQNTAHLFTQLCSACVFVSQDGKAIMDARVPSLGGDAGNNSLKAYGLNFDALNVLNEHGLIISDYNSWYDCRASIGLSSNNESQLIRTPFQFQGRYWVLTPKKSHAVGKIFKLHGVALTRVGRQLSRIVDSEPMNEYVQALLKFFETRGLSMTETDNWEPQLFKIDAQPQR